MNKFVKICLIISGSLLALGAVCFMIGRMLGGITNFNYSINNRVVVGPDEELIRETIELEAFSEIVVDATSTDVELIKGDDYKLEICVPEQLRPEIVQDNGSLRIIEPNYNIYFNIGGLNSHTYYRITVPLATEIMAELNATSGDIVVSDISVSGKIDMTSGDAVIKNIKSAELHIHSTSGDIEIKDSSIENLDTENTSGDVEFSAVDSQKIESQTTSGEIVYNNVSVDELTSESTSGDFDGSKIKAYDINISCTSGNVEFEVFGEQSEYDCKIKTNSGNIKVGTVETEHEYSTKENTDKIICANTSSGNISIDFIKQ